MVTQAGLETDLTKLLGIKYPIMCAGMAQVTGADLAAAVSNAGGIGTIGAIGLSPDGLRAEIKKLKSMLVPGGSIAGTVPFGVDLLLPQVGGGGRKTNYDYTGGTLNQLVDVMCEEKVPLFVSAVGIPPKEFIERFHANGMLYANLIGSPKQVLPCIKSGADIIIATGGEAGGHTGDISSMVLLPQVADLCKDHKVVFVGGGGIFDGRGIAACFALGASGVWVGTRFLSSLEANANKGGHRMILQAKSSDTLVSEFYTGRPCRIIKNKHNTDWANRTSELRTYLKAGIIPMKAEAEKGNISPHTFITPAMSFAAGRGKNPKPGVWNDIREDEHWDVDTDASMAGQAVGGINSAAPAAYLVKTMMDELVSGLQSLGRLGAQVP